MESSTWEGGKYSKILQERDLKEVLYEKLNCIRLRYNQIGGPFFKKKREDY
jgi:hypothetical protein